MRTRLDWGTSIARSLRDARKDPGLKSPTQQLREMFRLRRSETELSPRDYYDYRIDELGRWDDDELPHVVGRRMQVRLQRAVNNSNWEAVVSDKLIMAMVFRAAGIAQPELVAVATAYDRACGDVPILHGRSEIIDFLAQAPMPLFCKPVCGGYGDGCHRIESVHVAAPPGASRPEVVSVTIDRGRSVPIEQFLDELHDSTGWGFQFQRVVRPHPDTAPFVGDAISGLRLVTLLGDDGPRLFRAYWKIPSRDSVTDNVGDGTSGNRCAEIDTASGRIQTISDLGRRSSMDGSLPDRRDIAVGVRVPLWDEAVAATLEATRAFPGIRLQAWDVGLSSEGPVMFEMNMGGGVWEDAIPRGTYDDELREFVEEYGHEVQHRRHRGTPPRRAATTVGGPPR